MTAWAEAYRIQSQTIDSCGLSLTEETIVDVAVEVQALLEDTSGVAAATAALGDLPGTEFEEDRLQDILTASGGPTPEWKVGEALAEHLLATQHGCEFPWPNSRSQRNPNSIDGGVDLVGFHHEGDAPRFALGEVKTSCQQTSPPTVLTGRHGLAAQLSGLADVDDRARWAIKYLGMQAVDRPWMPKYRDSMKRYLNDPADISLFGGLVRSTVEDPKDLEAVTRRSEPLVTGSMTFVLRALYVGPTGLATLAGGDVELETTS